MFAQARTVGWLEAVESTILDVMSTRISTCQIKHIDQEPGEVVPRVAQILKKRWDAAAASITVVQLVPGCGDFNVVEPSTVRDSNKDPHMPSMPYNAGQPNILLSAWLCYLLEMKENDFSYILRNLVHQYYKFEYIQQMYKNNIFPACIHNVKYKGMTRPPAVTK